MQFFNVRELLAKNQSTNQPWLEFLRVPSLSMGVYSLNTSQEDLQQPHTEDEVYYVLNGKASFQAGDEKRPVGPGTLIFVEQSVEHRFCEIIEDLTVLVLFAPREGSLKREQV